MKEETAVIIRALKAFMLRKDVIERTIQGKAEGKGVPKAYRGKDVQMPLGALLQGIFHRMPVKQIADTLDNNTEVVEAFLDELYITLESYIRNKQGGAQNLDEDISELIEEIPDEDVEEVEKVEEQEPVEDTEAKIYGIVRTDNNSFYIGKDNKNEELVWGEMSRCSMAESIEDMQFVLDDIVSLLPHLKDKLKIVEVY